MRQATFVLSTGRCGTQWLADLLERSAGDAALVVHEPVEAPYSTRAMLAAHRPEHLPATAREALSAHIASIERTLERCDYIECGHPLWSSLPYLLGHFAGRVRAIHLLRHPIPTAWSWLTHRAYCPPLAPHLPEKILVAAADEGLRFAHYRERWSTMTPFEKALFYWAEVHALGLELESRTSAPWLRVHSEALFAGNGLDVLHRFLGLDPNRCAYAADSPVDRFRYVVDSGDPRQIERHPEFIELARTLGYDAMDFDVEKLSQRYFFDIIPRGD
jgi:hypothetical protein